MEQKRNFRIKIPKDMTEEKLINILHKHNIIITENRISNKRKIRLDKVLNWLQENPKEVLSTSQYCALFQVAKKTAYEDIKLLHKNNLAYSKTYLGNDNKARTYLGINKEMVEIIVKVQD
jgi:hypothetical protein